MGVKHPVESFGEGLQEVEAVGALDRVGGALSGPVGIGLRPITDDHADAGMGQ
jgi:hypothetical protein